jgi:hypothetical protein
MMVEPKNLDQHILDNWNDFVNPAIAGKRASSVFDADIYV